LKRLLNAIRRSALIELELPDIPPWFENPSDVWEELSLDDVAYE